MGKFTTLLLGGAIGAGIALLATPRTGAENRALIAENLNENYPEAVSAVNATASQVIDNVATTSTKAINTVVDKGAEVKKGLGSRAQQTAPMAVEKNDELRDKIDAARERIAAQVAKNAEAVHDAAVDKVPGAIDAAKAASDKAKEAVATAEDKVKGAAKAAKEATEK